MTILIIISLVLGSIGSGLGIYLTIVKIKDQYQKPELEIKGIDEKIFNAAESDDKPEKLIKVSRILIENKKKKKAKDCVGVLFIEKRPETEKDILEKKVPLHWADTNPSSLVCSTKPITVTNVLPRPLDVVFTKDKGKYKGAWIASHFALKNPKIGNNQFRLVPGEYKVTIKVDCSNGKGDEKKYMIISPEKWDDLEIKEI